MYTVYVLKNSKGILYKGLTSDLSTRIQQHNDGLSPWTKNKGPWTLVYQKQFSSRSEATQYEKFLKTGKGREFIKNFLNGV